MSLTMSQATQVFLAAGTGNISTHACVIVLMCLCVCVRAPAFCVLFWSGGDMSNLTNLCHTNLWIIEQFTDRHVPRYVRRVQ